MKKLSVIWLIVFLCFLSGYRSAYGSSVDLITALNGLEDHITGTNPLSGSEIANHKATIDSNKSYFETDYNITSYISTWAIHESIN